MSATDEVWRTSPSATRNRYSAVDWLRAEPGALALVFLAVTALLLVGLARAGWFDLWWVSLAPLAAAVVCGAWAWWLYTWFDRVAIVLLLLIAALLYLPPAQQVSLSGDAGIYTNEAAWLARTGGVRGPYLPLLELSPEARDLFYIGSDEQFDGRYTVQAYDGLLYGGYYVVDPGDASSAPTIRQSRPGQTSAWQAMMLRAAGPPFNFALGFAAGTVGLWLLYAIGRRIAPAWVALWSATLVAISLPQVYLFRLPLSEPVGQVWTLAGLWLAVRWLQAPRPRPRWPLAAALLMWTTAWSARIDSFLLAGPALLLLSEAARERNGRILQTVAGILPALALLAILGTNPPYVGATVEISRHSEPLFLPALSLLMAAALPVLFVLWRWGERLTAFYRRSEKVWHTLIFLLAAFAVLWSTLPNPLRVEGVTRPFQEIIWFSSASLTPLLYWMALAGVGLILWRRPGAAQGFLLLATVGLGAAFYLDYTSAPVYPISLRRLVADVVPLLALMAGQALTLLGSPVRRKAAPGGKAVMAAQVALAVAAIVWMGVRMAPVYSLNEGEDELAFVEELAAQIPDNGVLIFEPQDEDSWIGWLAAPLYSFAGRDALLLESDEPDPAKLELAYREIEAQNRIIYIASQGESLPAALAPPGATVQSPLRTTWRSSLIGQSRVPWPPEIWEFSLPLNVYRVSLADDAAPATEN